jgi:hypothetical protein
LPQWRKRLVTTITIAWIFLLQNAAWITANLLLTPGYLIVMARKKALAFFFPGCFYLIAFTHHRYIDAWRSVVWITVWDPVAPLSRPFWLSNWLLSDACRHDKTCRRRRAIRLAPFQCFLAYFLWWTRVARIPYTPPASLSLQSLFLAPGVHQPLLFGGSHALPVAL